MERGASIWSSNFLVEVGMKLGVLLAVPRSEVRKSPRALASCSDLVQPLAHGLFGLAANLIANSYG